MLNDVVSVSVMTGGYYYTLSEVTSHNLWSIGHDMNGIMCGVKGAKI